METGRNTIRENNVNLLSEREKEVVKLICKELTNKEIAKKLFIGVRTVETHRKHIIEKIGARNLAGIVIYGVKNELHIA